MSISPNELKESREESSIPFDWTRCPAKFRNIFQEALNSKNNTTLALPKQNISDNDVLIICKFLHAYPHITTLNVDAEYRATDQIGPKGAKALAANKTLLHLSLVGNAIGDEGAAAFKNNKTLQSLNATSCRITAPGIEALLQHSSLNTLEIRGNNIGNANPAAFVNTKLTTLDLSMCGKINIAIIQALTRNINIKKLMFRMAFIDNEGVNALATNTTITDLSIEHNFVKNVNFAPFEHNKTLKTFSLDGSWIDANVVLALARNTSITDLNLNSTDIKDADFTVFKCNNILKKLSLSQCCLDDKHALTLADTTITDLNLSQNKIGDIGALALMQSVFLLTLNLDSNPMSSPVCKELMLKKGNKNISESESEEGSESELKETFDLEEDTESTETKLGQELHSIQALELILRLASNFVQHMADPYVPPVNFRFNPISSEPQAPTAQPTLKRKPSTNEVQPEVATLIQKDNLRKITLF